MNYRDGLGLVAVALFFAGMVVCLYWLEARSERERLREKRSGRLPARRLPPPPTTGNLFLLIIFVLTWAFLPILVWLFMGLVSQVLTPPSARIYLAPVPPFSRMLITLLYWCLFWAGLGLLPWLVGRLWAGLAGQLTDPVLSRAEDLLRDGDLDGAVRELRGVIETNGPTVGRLALLADCLMNQGEWLEALRVSLDIEDRRRLDLENRRRKTLALCKLGLPDVALAEYLRTDRSTAQRLADVCAYCQALIDLGLVDRAWDQLRRAEVMFSARAVREANASRLRDSIDACRVRLAEHFPDKKPVGLDEL